MKRSNKFIVREETRDRIGL